MGRFSLATAPAAPALDAEVLPEDCVRDQLSAAEELLYVGHTEPALLASGAALEGALRLCGGEIAGYNASAGALLEALLATEAIDDEENELLYRVLAARDRLVHGFLPDGDRVIGARATKRAIGVMIRLLERVNSDLPEPAR
jgi:uncharacterized protein YutE (UPF0331/DUF86 family)